MHRRTRGGGRFHLCVATVRPAGSTTETNYDDKGEHDMGSVYFGDESTVAPAKKNNSLWEEEEE
nr:hypothetical protein [Segatella maculosa]